MPVVPGAAEALWRLSDAGVWIRLITHRLYANWGHAVAVADTVAWLDEAGIPYRDLCFLGDKPQVRPTPTSTTPRTTSPSCGGPGTGHRLRPALQPRARRAAGPPWTEVEELVPSCGSDAATPCRVASRWSKVAPIA